MLVVKNENVMVTVIVVVSLVGIEKTENSQGKR